MPADEAPQAGPVLGGAGILAVSGLFATLFPRWLLETVFAQPPTPDVWVRVAGVQAIGFAMLAVVIAHRLEELWWASWAYVITGASVTVLTAGYAPFGRPDGASAVLWWRMAVESVVITAGLLVGLAQTGTKRDPNAPAPPRPEVAGWSRRDRGRGTDTQRGIGDLSATLGLDVMPPNVRA